MALSRVKLDFCDIENDGSCIHEELMKSIFLNLVDDDSSLYRGTSGSHWEDRGVQRSDPRTDVRGAGTLGLLHLLYFAETYPKTAKCILEYSNQPSPIMKTAKSFPFAIKLFEFTTLLLKLLREGRLFSICNRHNSVIKTLSEVYSALVIVFAQRYIGR